MENLIRKIKRKEKKKKGKKTVKSYYIFICILNSKQHFCVYIYIYIFKRHNKNIFSYILYLINIVYLVNGKSTNKNKRKIKENKTTTKKQ